ncbi:carbohydrate sulfotransferase 9-like [Dendrobates tinctorius]|uniref:carbohydrate sulfotransferase 9-like n=1 Tax=Dendrobates tinctorius TaxID=92724 RepID=UPI003CC97B9D
MQASWVQRWNNLNIYHHINMRKVQQKVILLIMSSAIFALFLHYKQGKLNFQNVNPQYSVTEAQESRKAAVRSVCKSNNLSSSSFALDRKVAAQLYVDHSHRFIYCEVPKVGCSNWKRIILLLNESFGHTSYELQHYQVHNSKQLKKLSEYPPSGQKEFLANYTKVMFTRDPLERVVSAYRDKFLHEDDVYYRENITKLIKKSLGIQSKTNITFEQFANFITKENPYYRDTHWKPMYQLCEPCNIQYDFIGKFETLADDADFVLKIIGAPKKLKYPTMKHHANESRTNYDISIRYLEMLPPVLFRKLLSVYSLDFSIFDYSYYQTTISKLPKTT